MRIVGFDEFCALPEGTLFAYVVISERPAARKSLAIETDEERLGRASRLEGLLLKGRTISNEDTPPQPIDFYETDLLAELDADSPVAIYDPSTCRNGMFDPGQFFAVYDDEDRAALIEALQGAPPPEDTP